MEIQDRVVLTDDDMRLVEDFFRHYNDPKTNNLVLTDRLQQEINKFKEKTRTNTYTVEDQRSFAVALSGALATADHPLLKDVAIKDIMDACQNVWTDAQFYEEFEQSITSHPHRSREEG